MIFSHRVAPPLVRATIKGFPRCTIASILKSFNSSKKASLIQHFYYHTTTPLALELSSDKLAIPKHTRQKVISASDAVSLVNSGDTIYVSGFVTQGCAELVVKTLGERYADTGEPNSLTLLFGGGPGDYGEKGLNHFAKTKHGAKPMLKRTIGGHYGQAPKIAELALNEQVESWCLPMGSISRMLRSQSTHSPGHITTIGLGTFVDADKSGGAVNEKAKTSKMHKKLVTKITIDGVENLVYKALPIDVAIIRGTTADTLGNVTLEHESLKCDQMIAASAARNSGGITIAQVKHIAQAGSLPSRSIAVPGALVDCVVVVDQEDHDECHPMSYVTRLDPVLTGEVKAPQDAIQRIPLNFRKIIGRRALCCLKTNTVVNLGIGLPESLAAIAAEEGLSAYVTLSTEPGVFGGLPASGKNFGPSLNADAFLEMNQMFDFYDGGGLDLCYLGAAQVGKNGDVNVSRMSKDRLTGPGGFIDISQATPFVCFLCSFTAKGLSVSAPGDGSLKIEQEGTVKKFVNHVYECTFSGDEAVRRGQTVLYITERAVFRRSSQNDVIELIEIAPGIDLDKDILNRMEFEPAISPSLKKMDQRIFVDEKMNISNDLFGSLEDRCHYVEEDHRIFLEMFSITINTPEDLRWFMDGLENILKPLCAKKGRVAMVANYDGFDISPGLEDEWAEALQRLSKKYYRSSTRFTETAFKRAKLGRLLKVENWNPDDLFNTFDVNNNGNISIEELRAGMSRVFDAQLTPKQLENVRTKSHANALIDKNAFVRVVNYLLSGD